MTMRAIGKMRGTIRQHTRREPEALQVALLTGGDVIFIFHTSMQHVIIVDELHLADKRAGRRGR